MKELSIEEKAKRYDEALGKAKKELNTCGSQNCDAARQIFRFFPELKESEDERTRKELLSLFEDGMYGRSHRYTGSDCERYIAWLEKQGKNDMGISEATKQVLEDNLNKALEKETPESWNKFLDEQGEQKSVWSEEDESILQNILVCLKNGWRKVPTDILKYESWLKSLKERMKK